MVDCCAPIQVHGAGLRLEERSDEHAYKFDKFRLYECPSCAALWVAHDVFWDHGTWYRKEYIRVADLEAFEEVLASAKAANNTTEPVSNYSKELTPTDITRGFQIAITIGRDKRNKSND